MAITIEDGKGKGFQAGVSKYGRLETTANSSPRIYFASRDFQRSFSAMFADASAEATNYVAYIKNTSTTRDMIVNIVRVSAVNAAVWQVVVATGTATGGNAVTAVNLNLASGITPEATLLADNIGGFTAGTVIAKDRHVAGGTVDFSFGDSLIIGPQNAIAVNYLSGTTGEASCTIAFYYEDLNQ